MTTDADDPFFIHRDTWPPGPWDEEPSAEAFDLRGLHCQIKRGRLGSLCGYVEIPADHPWHGLAYYSNPLLDVHVHGGLTFSGPIEGAGWWLGFDCAHGDDLIPLIPPHGDGLIPLIPRIMVHADGPTYRDWAYVKREIGSLADQVLHATTNRVPLP